MPTTRTGATTAKKASASKPAKKVPVVAPADIIEISSDEDDDLRPVPPRRNKGNDRDNDELRNKVKMLENEKAALQRANQRISKENDALKACGGTGGAKIALDKGELENAITCELCSANLWQPAILPDCGHVFCQSCTIDWFQTILNTHLQRHPHYNPNMGTMHQAQLFGFNASPHPKYICPKCRAEVKNRPTEDFALKSLVRTISSAMGENSPKKPGVARGGGQQTSPWDRFVFK